MQDFEAGLEYAQGLEILDMRQRGDSRAYLVRCVTGLKEECSGDSVLLFSGVLESLVQVWVAGPSTPNASAMARCGGPIQLDSAS